MKHKILKSIIILSIAAVLVSSSAFLTYRYVMINQIISLTDNGHTAYSTVFNQTDVYNIDWFKYLYYSIQSSQIKLLYAMIWT